jgi:plasmid stabilization system protein ParE
VSSLEDRRGPASATTLYSQLHHPRKAISVLAVKDSLKKLVVFPNMRGTGDRQGTRELVIPPYVVVYRMKEETIELLHVHHGAQD